jgi:hypothetical protein
MAATVCGFKEVYVWIPRKVIRKCYSKTGYLSDAECRVLQSKLVKIEEAQIKLAHVRSVVERCLLKKC